MKFQSASFSISRIVLESRLSKEAFPTSVDFWKGNFVTANALCDFSVQRSLLRGTPSRNSTREMDQRLSQSCASRSQRRNAVRKEIAISPRRSLRSSESERTADLVVHDWPVFLLLSCHANFPPPFRSPALAPVRLAKIARFSIRPGRGRCRCLWTPLFPEAIRFGPSVP